MITDYPDLNCICIDAASWSYQIEVRHRRYILHRYFGPKMQRPAEIPFSRYLGKNYGSIHPDSEFPEFSYEAELLEYSSPGKGDYRIPAFLGSRNDGSPVFWFTYVSHRIVSGACEIPGLPSVYALPEDRAQTLELLCRDDSSGLEVTLCYTVLPEYDILLRWCRYTNNGSNPVFLHRAASICLDIDRSSYDLLTLQGAYARERIPARIPACRGITSFSSLRGISSHHQNPFLGVLAPETTEHSGMAMGLLLVYSGNHCFEIEVDAYGGMRIVGGMHDQSFSWKLIPGESLHTPQVIMTRCDDGMHGMSRRFHEIIRTRLCRGPWRDRPRPVLANSWEASYFRFTRDDIVSLAGEAADLGIELFVLDDGWFSGRNDDTSGLGDWKTDTDKLPGGLRSLSEAIHAKGLLMGIWVEPEMVSPGSRLLTEHPDWVLGSREQQRTTGRNQLILDLTREDVQDFLIGTIDRILSDADADYIKWDANRCFGEFSSAALHPDRQGEIAPRYILGLYRVISEVVSRHPDVLFEGCAGGGGRYDPGMLAWMPQYWTSDNTDALSRISIQYGTSIVYPPVTMGAHVSAVPNHQLGRSTSLSFRGHVAQSGNLGYELDLRKLSDAQKNEVRSQVAWYKQWRDVIQFGEFFRIASFTEGEEAAWMAASRDKKRALLFCFRRLAEVSQAPGLLRLPGLCPSTRYIERTTGITAWGEELISRGFPVSWKTGDCISCVYEFTACTEE